MRVLMNVTGRRPGWMAGLAWAVLVIQLAGSGAWAEAGFGNFDKAAAYSRQHAGLALIIARGHDILYEDYSNRATADTGLPLASGTKSFWCAAYAAGIEDGLFQPDTLVSSELTEWQADRNKRDITVRQLLSYTSGLDNGVRELRKSGNDDQYSQVLKVRSIAPPGQSFQYGPSHVTAFGAFLVRRLNGETAQEYLQRRVFAPIGLQVYRWRHDAAGMPTMAGGVRLKAREWLKYGQLLAEGGQWNGRKVLEKKYLDDCVRGTEANPMFGLTFWLNSAPDPRAASRRGNPIRPDNLVNGYIAPSAPRDMFMAVGAGNQRLYIIPSLDLTIVRFGRKNRGWRDNDFLSLVLK